MGVYINMEMPTGYGAITIQVWPDGQTEVIEQDGEWKTTESVHVPAHGRLIDVAALWMEINKICDRRDAGIITDLTCLQQILSAVRHAPTIIPESEEGET